MVKLGVRKKKFKITAGRTIFRKSTPNLTITTRKFESQFAPGNRQVWSQFSKNRPTCCDFEIFFPDPQLHQIFKPIRHLLCTFSSCSVLSIYMIYNIYKFQGNQRPKICSFISEQVNLIGNSFLKSYVFGTSYSRAS